MGEYHKLHQVPHDDTEEDLFQTLLKVPWRQNPKGLHENAAEDPLHSLLKGQ
jgi:hypothetical protein